MSLRQGLPRLQQVKFVISGVNKGIAVSNAGLRKENLRNVVSSFEQGTSELISCKRPLRTVNGLFNHQYITHLVLILFDLTNIQIYRVAGNV